MSKKILAVGHLISGNLETGNFCSVFVTRNS